MADAWKQPNLFRSRRCPVEAHSVRKGRVRIGSTTHDKHGPAKPPQPVDWCDPARRDAVTEPALVTQQRLTEPRDWLASDAGNTVAYRVSKVRVNGLEHHRLHREWSAIAEQSRGSSQGSTNHSNSAFRRICSKKVDTCCGIFSLVEAESTTDCSGPAMTPEVDGEHGIAKTVQPECMSCEALS